jgi:hypothetical protein
VVLWAKGGRYNRSKRGGSLPSLLGGEVPGEQGLQRQEAALDHGGCYEQRENTREGARRRRRAVAVKPAVDKGMGGGWRSWCDERRQRGTPGTL